MHAAGKETENPRLPAALVSSICKHLNISKKQGTSLIKCHLLLYTDFGFIFENYHEIVIFRIGTLVTNADKDGVQNELISKTRNYSGESDTRHVKLFSKPYIVNRNNQFEIRSDAVAYFDESSIRSETEASIHYQNLKAQAIQHLEQRNIKFRLAETDADYALTGFRLFYKKSLEDPHNTTWLGAPKRYVKINIEDIISD